MIYNLILLLLLCAAVFGLLLAITFFIAATLDWLEACKMKVVREFKSVRNFTKNVHRN